MTKNNYLVICDNSIFDSEHILQVVSKARSLADVVSGKVCVLCIGEKDEDAFDSLMEYGADIVLFNEYRERLDYHTMSLIACKAVNSFNIGVVFVPASDKGKAVAAVMSIKLQAGLTADCIDIFYDDNLKLNFSRAAINDSVVAVIQCINCEVNMCTVKEGAFIKEKPLNAKNGHLEIYDYTPENLVNNYSVIEVLEKIELVNINTYNKVFCIGRGVGDVKIRDRIIELAEKYDAGVVGTRAVVEKGIIDKEYQVGQSGKSINPILYVGFGVSGASQHMVGIKNCDRIIAINSDPDATIFDYCNYAFIEDANKLIDIIINTN